MCRRKEESGRGYFSIFCWWRKDEKNGVGEKFAEVFLEKGLKSTISQFDMIIDGKPIFSTQNVDG